MFQKLILLSILVLFNGCDRLDWRMLKFEPMPSVYGAEMLPNCRAEISVAYGYAYVTQVKRDVDPVAAPNAVEEFVDPFAGSEGIAEAEPEPTSTAATNQPKGEWVLYYQCSGGSCRPVRKFVPYNSEGNLEIVDQDPQSLYKWVRKNNKWVQVLRKENQ